MPPMLHFWSAVLHPDEADNPSHSFSITRLAATPEIYWQTGRAIFHKSAPNLMIPLQSLRMRAAPAVAQAVRTQRKISAARSSSARNRTVGRKRPAFPSGSRPSAYGLSRRSGTWCRVAMPSPTRGPIPRSSDGLAIARLRARRRMRPWRRTGSRISGESEIGRAKSALGTGHCYTYS